MPNATRLSYTPVKALELIREYRSLDAQPLWKQHFERVTLHVRSDGAAEGQAYAPVVRAGRNDHGGAMARLLVTRLWVGVKPDQVDARRTIGRPYHAMVTTTRPDQAFI